MTTNDLKAPTAALDGDSPFKLVLERTFNAPPELVYQCWTDETLLKQWFVPAPWSLHSADMDVRAGGKFNSTMKDPEGNIFPNEGIFLEVTPNRKLVTTDAFRQGYLPSKNAPFMVAHVEFIPQNGGQQTRYIATAHHWNLDTQKQHEAMGFHDGWGAAADQLAALLAKLQAKA